MSVKNPAQCAPASGESLPVHRIKGADAMSSAATLVSAFSLTTPQVSNMRDKREAVADMVNGGESSGVPGDS